MRRSTLALALWTLLVWGTRLRNDVGILPLTFLALAVAALVWRRDRTVPLVLVGWTVAVWVVRAVDIVVLSDHDTAFVVVHLVLAVVSIGLASWVVRDVSARRRSAPAIPG